MILYVYYTAPELRTRNYQSGSGKGAGPLKREQRGSKKAQRGSTEGTRGSTEAWGIISEQERALWGSARVQQVGA